MSEGAAGIVALTVGTAALATACILPLGVLAAYGLSRWRGRGKQVVETLLSLPLVLPPTAVGLVLLQVFASRGALGKLLGALGVEVVFTWKAVVLCAAVMSFPLLVRSARTSFEEIDGRLLGVARTLGASPAQAFLRVALPLAGRGVVAGALLAFCRALGEFGATILVAGNIPGRTQTLALAVFQRIQLGEDGEAAKLAGIAAGLAFTALFASEWLMRSREA